MNLKVQQNNLSIIQDINSGSDDRHVHTFLFSRIIEQLEKNLTSDQLADMLVIAYNQALKDTQNFYDELYKDQIYRIIDILSHPKDQEAVTRRLNLLLEG